MLGLLLCLSVVRVSRASAWTEKLSKYGVYTLWIYVGHTFLISAERKLLPQTGITYDIFMALLIATLYCTLFILLAKCFYRGKTAQNATH